MNNGLMYVVHHLAVEHTVDEFANASASTRMKAICCKELARLRKESR